MGLEYKDNLSPALAAAARKLEDRRPILYAMGQELVSITRQSFEDASLRAAPWPPKKDGTPATLKKTSLLQRSIRLTALTPSSVTVGTDRPYAAIHQLGGTTRAHIIEALRKKALAWKGAAHPVKRVKHPGSKIPARPFFPFTPAGEMTAQARQRIEAIARRKLNKLLGV
jgi:phage gpG-like protein